MKNIVYLIILVLYFTSNTSAQKISLTSFFGQSYAISKNAGGYELGIGLNVNTSNISNIGISITHIYNDNTTLPSNLTASRIILKESSNRLPLGFGAGHWLDDNSWPLIRLQEQPNRYFKFNFGVHYSLMKPLKKLDDFSIRIGALLSYCDESELIKMVETEKISGVFVRPTDHHYIPVFSYNTYLDLGFRVDLDYLIVRIRSSKLGFRSSILAYPKSGSFIINNGLTFTLD